MSAAPVDRVAGAGSPSAGGGVIALVVFDWDGTLIDSTAGIAQAICLAATDLGLPEPPAERARHVIGMGLMAAIQYAVPTITAGQLPLFIDRYRGHLVEGEGRLHPYPGVVDLLEDLHARGVPLAIATGMSRAGLERSLSQLKWHSLFASTRCGEEGLPKPDPWMLRDLCDTLAVDPGQTLMVGDTTHDLGMAAALGSPCVAMTYGAHPRAALAARAPAAVLDSMAELRDWLWPRLRGGPREVSADPAWQLVCESVALVEGGAGVRFDLPPLAGAARDPSAPLGRGLVGRIPVAAVRPARVKDPAPRPAFVVRHDGVARAYLNRCAHVAVELDWPSGQFFDDSGLYLVCATHGATYRAADGRCVGGPCRGSSLVALQTRESNGKVWVALEASSG